MLTNFTIRNLYFLFLFFLLNISFLPSSAENSVTFINLQKNAEAACERGEKYMQAKNYTMAYKSFSEAIKTNPTPKYYCQRGACLMLQKKFNEAGKDFDKAISLDKNYAQAHFMKGTTFQFLAETTKAISAYSQAISINNNYAEAYLMRGLLYATLKNKALACNDLNTSLKLGVTLAQQHINEICK